MIRIVKILVICVAVIAFGVSFRTLVSKGAFSYAADDIQKEAVKTETAPAAPAPATAVPESPANTYDFSDSTSWNLTVSAWEHLAAKDYDGTYAYVRKCLELYETKAKEMALTMRRFATAGHEDDFALVNDVATAHYVMGEALMKQEKYDAALKEFELVIAAYPYAQCWDPKGWFWKVAEVSRKNIEKISKLKK